jgi:hypothetical protein
MTIQELFELAHLDALGLLDGDEQAAFERAFAAAPASIKSQIRAEQARWAYTASLLPDAEPSPELRARVLEAVSEAMLRHQADHPEATLELHPSRRVAKWWRTASIGLLCAAVIFGAAFLKVMDENARLSEQVANNATMNELMKLKTGGQELNDTFLAADLVRVVFDRTDAAEDARFSGQAAVYWHARWQRPRFYCANLPLVPNASYRLVSLTPEGRVDQTLLELPAERALNTYLLPELARGTRLAVIMMIPDVPFDASRHVLLTATL